MALQWDLDELLAFIESWSGARAYVEAHGDAAMADLEASLAARWGDRNRRRVVTWEFVLRVARFGTA